MPYPPPNKARYGFPLLEREALDFYWNLPTDRTISVSERYDFWIADIRILLRRLTRIMEQIPEAKRQIGNIKRRKVIIYAVDHNGDPIGFTTWNRDPDQRLISIFKLFDPVQVGGILIMARLYGCRRSKSQKSILAMHALHGIVIIPTSDGFAPLVQEALLP